LDGLCLRRGLLEQLKYLKDCVEYATEWLSDDAKDTWRGPEGRGWGCRRKENTSYHSALTSYFDDSTAALAPGVRLQDLMKYQDSDVEFVLSRFASYSQLSKVELDEQRVALLPKSLQDLWRDAK
jgi:hypothetical protein